MKDGWTSTHAGSSRLVLGNISMTEFGCRSLIVLTPLYYLGTRIRNTVPHSAEIGLDLWSSSLWLWCVCAGCSFWDPDWQAYIIAISNCTARNVFEKQNTKESWVFIPQTIGDQIHKDVRNLIKASSSKTSGAEILEFKLWQNKMWQSCRQF